jgi:hypothetical protein
MELQDECEKSGRVLYPLYIENDDYDKSRVEVIIREITEVIETMFNLESGRCTWYYSGSRSLHVHVPMFVTEASLPTLRQTVKDYARSLDTKLDTGIYSRKRQFRLPGAVHRKTGLRKAEIRPDWSHEEIFRASNDGTPLPATALDLIQSVFSQSYGRTTPQEQEEKVTEWLLNVFDSDEHLFDPAPKTVEARLLPQEMSLAPSREQQSVWDAYNRKEFSPYANAGGKTGRSVAVLRPIGGPFSRVDEPSRVYVPAHFFAAISCAGKSFIKYDEHAPVQLSDRDREKWEFGVGENVVIIGGRSRNSRIFTVDNTTARTLKTHLNPETGSRRTALSYLKRKGYDVGTSGSASRTRKSRSSRGTYEQVLPATDPRTEAGVLQQRAEQKGIHTLDYLEIRKVGNRLLYKYEWNATWRWFQERYGQDFKPDVTWRELSSIVESYNDLSHIQVPPEP